MKKVLETIQFVFGVVIPVGFLLLVGSVYYEADWIFATTVASAIVVFVLVSIAEWFYDKGQKDTLPTEEESE